MTFILWLIEKAPILFLVVAIIVAGTLSFIIFDQKRKPEILCARLLTGTEVQIIDRRVYENGTTRDSTVTFEVIDCHKFKDNVDERIKF